MTQEKQISHDIRAIWGFDDGHVEVKVKSGIPLVGEITLTLDAEKLFRVGDVLNQAFDHLKALGDLKPRNREAGGVEGNADAPNQSRYMRRR